MADSCHCAGRGGPLQDKKSVPRGSRRRRLDCSLVTLASHASPPAAQIELPRGSRACAPSPGLQAPSPARPPNRLGCSRVAIPSHIAQAATEPQHHAPGRPTPSARPPGRPTRVWPARPASSAAPSNRPGCGPPALASRFAWPRPPGRPARSLHSARGSPSSARTSSRRR